MAYDQPSFQRPLSYDQILLEQLQRICQDARGLEPDRMTLSNITLLEVLTIIDHDKQYNDDIQAIKDKEAAWVEANLIDVRNNKQNDRNNLENKARLKYTMDRLQIIMECLKRAGRFPMRGEISFEGSE